MPAPSQPQPAAASAPPAAPRTLPDTAHWVALYRAHETERPDALFHDPFARRLAGPQAERILAASSFARDAAWSFIARTILFDAVVNDEVRAGAGSAPGGADTVINLAAGLDARPYRMDLPSGLRWFEIDYPEIHDHKGSVLANDKPRCILERIPLDLSDEPARRAVFQRIARDSRRTLILSEGLLVYLSDAQVDSLARDLAVEQPFKRWALDLGSPGLLAMLQKRLGAEMSRGATALKFAPPEGPDWFTPRGWTPLRAQSFLRAPGIRKRLPTFLKLISFLPQTYRPPGQRPWGGIVLLERP